MQIEGRPWTTSAITRSSYGLNQVLNVGTWRYHGLCFLLVGSLRADRTQVFNDFGVSEGNRFSQGVPIFPERIDVRSVFDQQLDCFKIPFSRGSGKCKTASTAVDNAIDMGTYFKHPLQDLVVTSSANHRDILLMVAKNLRENPDPSAKKRVGSLKWLARRRSKRSAERRSACAAGCGFNKRLATLC